MDRPGPDVAPSPEVESIRHEAFVRGFLTGVLAAAGLILFVGGLLANWSACP